MTLGNASTSKMIKEKYGVEYLLRQLAEECCELAQASLKLVRTRHPGETPVSVEEARPRFYEELADVQILCDMMLDIMHTDERYAVDKIYLAKEARMIKRLLGEGEENA